MSDVFKQKIRRDLSRWSRKLLLCIGLETIGRELVGVENWRHLYPAEKDWEQDKNQVSDFDFDPGRVAELEETIPTTPTTPDLSHLLDPCASPEEEDEDDEEEEQNEDKTDPYNENIFHLLPYWYFINRALGVPSVGGAGNISGDLRNTNPLLEALDAQQLNTLFLLHSLKQQQQLQVQGSQEVETPLNHVQNLLLQSHGSGELGNSLTHAQGYPGFPFGTSDYTQFLRNIAFSNPGLSTSISTINDLEQPLDLTQKKKVIVDKSLDGKNSCQIPTVTEVTSSNGRDTNVLEQYSKSTVKSSPRAGRGYTSQELEAALRDIQSGKLGTRRAAVIYGIPRSTLRNKVYKLGKDLSRPYRQKEKPAQESPKPTTSVRTLRQNSNRVDESSLINRGFPTESGFSSIYKNSTQLAPTPARQETKEVVKSEEEVISREKKALKEWLQSKLLRQRLNNLETPNIEIRNNTPERPIPIPIPPPKPILRSISDSSDCSDDAKQETKPNSLLRISNDLDRRKLLKRKLYDDDEESLSSRITPASAAVSTITSPNEIFQNNEDCSMDESDLSQTNGTEKGRDFYDSLDPRSPGYNSDADGNGKKSRPKRGKYRNYDRDALLKAVKAVQNGEMSVHRAGSYFGVPHSTLEYKVKERHLLRRPKRKDPKSGQKSSPESSLSGSEPGSIRMECSPVASSTRETLSRFLTIGPRSSTASPDSSSRASRLRSNKRNSTDFNSVQNIFLRKGEAVESSCSSPFINSFHLNDLIRHKDDNSLLDLTKKSS